MVAIEFSSFNVSLISKYSLFVPVFNQSVPVRPELTFTHFTQAFAHFYAVRLNHVGENAVINADNSQL